MRDLIPWQNHGLPTPSKDIPSAYVMRRAGGGMSLGEPFQGPHGPLVHIFTQIASIRDGQQMIAVEACGTGLPQPSWT